VVVHVDAAVLADPEQPGQSVLEEGSHVPAGTSQQLACDASRVVIRHDGEGRVMEVGARTRTIPPALPADPVAALPAQQVAQGLRLHARTTCPGWLGERLEVGWAIDVLHPLATTSGRRSMASS